jgi:hypothetical protein
MNVFRMSARPIADSGTVSDKPRMGKLALRYCFDDSDDFGRLGVEITTDKFSGRGGFWVQWQEVRDFGEKLSTYPVSADAPLSAAWGYEMHEGDDLIVRIQIAPANSTGDLRVRVELADENEPSERVRASFLTNYPDLEQFGIGIAALMDRETDEAVLAGR